MNSRCKAWCSPPIYRRNNVLIPRGNYVNRLGAAETTLGFGQERNYADYRFAYHDLAQNSKLSAEQRLKAFEQLQNQYPDVA